MATGLAQRAEVTTRRDPKPPLPVHRYKAVAPAILARIDGLVRAQVYPSPIHRHASLAQVPADGRIESVMIGERH